MIKRLKIKRLKGCARAVVAFSIFNLLTFYPFNLFAVDPALLMHTKTDPTRMRLGKSDAVCLMAGFLRGGEKAFTATVWVRAKARETAPLAMFSTMWSVEPARATREGGALLPATREFGPVDLAGGSAGGAFADPDYATHGCVGWDYGCYAVNVETDVPLTVTIAGCERNVAPSNGVKQAFNMQGTAADWSWTVAGAANGNVSFGFATNPLVRFYGECAAVIGLEMTGESQRLEMPSISNQWTMCATRVRLDGNGHAMEKLAAFTWDGETWQDVEKTNEVAAATFAKDASVRLNFMAIASAAEVLEDMERYGGKLIEGWLTDDQLRNVRDLDMFEMRRRGFTRWRND